MLELLILGVGLSVGWVWGGISQIRHEASRAESGFLSLPDVCHELLRRCQVRVSSLF
jgi:hypothetical protein